MSNQTNANRAASACAAEPTRRIPHRGVCRGAAKKLRAMLIASWKRNSVSSLRPTQHQRQSTHAGGRMPCPEQHACFNRRFAADLMHIEPCSQSCDARSPFPLALPLGRVHHQLAGLGTNSTPLRWACAHCTTELCQVPNALCCTGRELIQSFVLALASGSTLQPLLMQNYVAFGCSDVAEWPQYKGR